MKPESALASVKGHLRVSAPALLSVGAGALFMLLLFSETLAPGYDDWMMVHDDPAQHIVGWNFFRFSEWTFPPGLIKNYGPPTGVSISYTDALPLLAFPFKAIAFLLPTRFQYFGIWLLLSYMLQGLFGYLVVRAVTRDDWLGLLGACFFIQSPIMLWRVQFHLALAGHWLVLAGIWLNIRRHERFQHAGWMVVLVMSLLTHPYLALMNIFLMLADALRLWRPARKKTFSRMLLFVAEQTAVLAMAAWLLGLFGAEFQKEGTGYGLYSLNLNALFNPTSYLQNWSRLFPKLGLVYKQRFEGFNYLGLGGMILLFAGVAGTLLKRDIAVFKRQFPLALVCTCLTLLALSHTVAFGEHILFRVPLPSFLMETLSTFRASGRLFWPVYYLLLVFSIYAVARFRRPIVLAVLGGAILAQAWDCFPAYRRLERSFEGIEWENPLKADYWERFPEDFRHVKFLDDPGWRLAKSVAYFAAQHGMTLNHGKFGRMNLRLERERHQTCRNFAAGQIDPDTLYVVHSKDLTVEQLVHTLDLNEHLLAQINGIRLLIPGGMRNPRYQAEAREMTRLRQTIEAISRPGDSLLLEPGEFNLLSARQFRPGIKLVDPRSLSLRLEPGKKVFYGERTDGPEVRDGIPIHLFLQQMGQLVPVSDEVGANVELHLGGTRHKLYELQRWTVKNVREAIKLTPGEDAVVWLDFRDAGATSPKRVGLLTDAGEAILEGVVIHEDGIQALYVPGESVSQQSVWVHVTAECGLPDSVVLGPTRPGDFLSFPLYGRRRLSTKKWFLPPFVCENIDPKYAAVFNSGGTLRLPVPHGPGAYRLTVKLHTGSGKGGRQVTMRYSCGSKTLVEKSVTLNQQAFWSRLELPATPGGQPLDVLFDVEPKGSYGGWFSLMEIAIAVEKVDPSIP